LGHAVLIRAVHGRLKPDRELLSFDVLEQTRKSRRGAEPIEAVPVGEDHRVHGLASTISKACGSITWRCVRRTSPGSKPSTPAFSGSSPSAEPTVGFGYESARAS